MRVAIGRYFVCLALACLPAQLCLAADDIYTTLVTKGIALAADETVKLPQPILADGLEGAEQRKTIESLLAGRYEWDEFSRKSVVSPLLLKIDDSERASGKLGRRVDLYFIAFGKLELLQNDDKLQEQLTLAAAGDADSNDGRVKVLSSDELAKRGLPASQTKSDPRWVAVETTLLNKVQINLTTRNAKTQKDDSLLIASILDPKFQGDADYPNCWRSISNDDLGRRQVGPPQPYPGLGAYVKATRLVDPAGAAFIEYHVVYAEPEGWFHGANLLRSKLPIVAQDLVRKLRRKMAESN
ncbi:MAG: hypothetical protein AB7G28_15305 [Pirellulales bacterium]